MWAWLESFTDKIAKFFKSPGGKVIKDAAAVFVRTLGPIAADLILQEAAKAVKLEELKTGLTGAMKKENVKAYLKALAAAKGYELTEKMLNNAVENAALALEA